MLTYDNQRIFNIILFWQAIPLPCPENFNTVVDKDRMTVMKIFCSYPDAPGPPRKPKAEIKSKTEIGLKWTPPESDGGSLVTGYSIEKYDVSLGKWVTVNQAQVCLRLMYLKRFTQMLTDNIRGLLF